MTRTRDPEKLRAQRQRYYQKNAAYWDEKNKERSRRVSASLNFVHTESPSQDLFDEIRASAAINVFALPPEKIAEWGLSRAEGLRAELMLFGISTAVKFLRRYPGAGSAESVRRLLEGTRVRGGVRLKAMRSASAQFARIVEMLDAHRIGDKLLGDCTKGDLLRAAADAEAVAGEATMNAQFYRLLADLLPEHGVTVRQANNRKEIVALLTTSFREAAE